MQERPIARDSFSRSSGPVSIMKSEDSLVQRALTDPK